MNKFDSDITIRLLKDSDSLTELTFLLHKSYKALADQGFRFLATFQDEETTKLRIKNCECYIMLNGQKMIGTICYRSPIVKEEHEYFNKPFVASFGQFAIDPEFQHLGLGSKLVEMAEKCALRDNAEEIALDTAEGATELISFYKNRGYTFHSYAKWAITNYRSVILRKKINADSLSQNPQPKTQNPEL
ncbi:hypothetical protein BH09BAC5_BH09BAC5_02740 [soil metagenome]